MPLRIAAGAVVVVLIVLVVVVAGGRGADERAVTVRQGLPEVGFPARGDRADDEALHASAVGAWRDRATRDGDSWEGADEDVHVLWAGRLGEETTVVATAGAEAALLTRRGPDDDGRSWEVATSRVDRSSPGVVAFEGAVLEPEGADATFRQARSEGEGAPPMREAVDGLWTRPGSALPEGALVLEGGVQTTPSTRRTGPVAVFTGAVPVVRELSDDVLRELSVGDASRIGGPARRLRAAAVAGTAEDPQPIGFPRVELVAERATAVGDVTVLATDARRRPVLSAGVGGNRETDGDVPGVRLGDADVAATGRAEQGPAFGAAYVRRGEDVFLLVATDELVRRVEVRAGADAITIARPGATRDGDAPTLPVAVVRAPWVPPDGIASMRTDAAIFGESASGTAVTPDVAADVVAVD